jgi:hypothetical protein
MFFYSAGEFPEYFGRCKKGRRGNNVGGAKNIRPPTNLFVGFLAVVGMDEWSGDKFPFDHIAPACFGCFKPAVLDQNFGCAGCDLSIAKAAGAESEDVVCFDGWPVPAQQPV